MEELVVRYVHFLAIIALISTLVGELVLVQKKMNLKDFKKLALVDGVYGLAAITTLVAGFLLWFVVGKPAEFYSANFVFHIKISLFVLVGLLSTIPTYFFFRKRNDTSEHILVPGYVLTVIRVELVLLALIPMFGVLIARGIGN